MWKIPHHCHRRRDTVRPWTRPLQELAHRRWTHPPEAYKLVSPPAPCNWKQLALPRGPIQGRQGIIHHVASQCLHASRKPFRRQVALRRKRSREPALWSSRGCSPGDLHALCTAGRDKPSPMPRPEVTSIWRRENTPSTPFLVRTLAVSDLLIVLVCSRRASLGPLLSVLDVHIFFGTPHGVRSQPGQDDLFAHGRSFQVASRCPVWSAGLACVLRPAPQCDDKSLPETPNRPR